MPTETAFTDVPIPDWDYQDVYGRSLFILVFPLQHPTAQACSIEKPIRVLILYDEDYEDLQGGVALSVLEPMAREFYEIEYIRDCRLRSIHSGEWKMAVGFENLEEYLSAEPTVAGEKVHLDTPMRVICLRKLKHNLQELNSRYGSPSTPK